MKCSIKFKPGAYNDIEKLPINIQGECFEMLDRLENNLHLGRPLENKYGIDLNGYYKIYFNNAKYRIIYSKTENVVEVKGISPSINIANIVGIGPRKNFAIYKTVGNRIS